MSEDIATEMNEYARLEEEDARKRGALSRLPDKALYRIKGEQYTSRCDLIEAIIEDDDGTLDDQLVSQGSFTELLTPEESLERPLQTLLNLINHIPLNGGECVTIPKPLLINLKERSLNVLNTLNK